MIGFKLLCAVTIFLVMAAGQAQAQVQDPVPQLIALLKSENVEVRRAAAYSLKYFPNDEAAIPGLIQLLGDKDARARENAEDALALMYPREAIPALIQATKRKGKENTLTRQKAAETLGRFLNFADVAIPDLILLINDKDEVETVQAAAKIALSRIQGGGWR